MEDQPISTTARLPLSREARLPVVPGSFDIGDVHSAPAPSRGRFARLSAGTRALGSAWGVRGAVCVVLVGAGGVGTMSRIRGLSRWGPSRGERALASIEVGTGA